MISNPSYASVVVVGVNPLSRSELCVCTGGAPVCVGKLHSDHYVIYKTKVIKKDRAFINRPHDDHMVVKYDLGH